MNRTPLKALAMGLAAATIGIAALSAPAEAGGNPASAHVREAVAQRHPLIAAAIQRRLPAHPLPNRATVSQFGTGHTAGIVQDGRGNVGIIVQNGTNHSASLQQSGNNNFYFIMQLGTGATADIVQEGDNGRGATVQFSR